MMLGAELMILKKIWFETFVKIEKCLRGLQ